MKILRIPYVLTALVLLGPLFCRAQVYSVAIYSAGTSYETLYSMALPFAPHTFKLQLRTWREDASGFVIMDVNHKAAPGDVHRRSIKVECGSETFSVPADFNLLSRRETDEVPVVKSEGDLVGLLTHCALTRGATMRTNGLPPIQATWIHDSRSSQDIIVVEGDRFAEVQKVLEQACGKPQPNMTSLNGNRRLLIYMPPEIGVLLNLTATWSVTIVSIIEKPKS
jgi:hypothetical protein